MTDPRATLSNTTLTDVRTRVVTTNLPLVAPSTRAHPNGPARVLVQGVYIEVDQSPTQEGELIIYYHEQFGINIVEPMVAVEINGSLVWKDVSIRARVTRSDTGSPWR